MWVFESYEDICLLMSFYFNRCFVHLKKCGNLYSCFDVNGFEYEIYMDFYSEWIVKTPEDEYVPWSSVYSAGKKIVFKLMEDETVTISESLRRRAANET